MSTLQETEDLSRFEQSKNYFGLRKSIVLLTVDERSAARCRADPRLDAPIAIRRGGSYGMHLLWRPFPLIELADDRADSVA